MKVNGLGRIEMAMEFKSGKMVQNMQANGKITKLMAKESSIMLMVIYMREIS